MIKKELNFLCRWTRPSVGASLLGLGPPWGQTLTAGAGRGWGLELHLCVLLAADLGGWAGSP